MNLHAVGPAKSLQSESRQHRVVPIPPKCPNGCVGREGRYDHPLQYFRTRTHCEASRWRPREPRSSAAEILRRILLFRSGDRVRDGRARLITSCFYCHVAKLFQDLSAKPPVTMVAALSRCKGMSTSDLRTERSGSAFRVPPDTPHGTLILARTRHSPLNQA